MANSKKYHPLDVRYKGPSTAYRGSAKWAKPARNSDTPAPADKSPWEAKTRPDANKMTLTAPAVSNKSRDTPQPKQTRGPVFWIIAAILFYIIFF